jgi:PBP1b-binding outer membrane lipoprotein LpoB
MGFGGGTTVNITVNGGLLGDRASAQELALALDRELYQLRKNNQSTAFDRI